MPSVIRRRVAMLALAACLGAAAWLAIARVQTSGARGLLAHATAAGPKMFNLKGYVLQAKYTKGRNTGNTFQQHYRARTVHGIPTAGPYVGFKFPREDYVAMPIGHHELYVAWMSTKKTGKNPHPFLDLFVMNFKTHRIWDYAPGSLKPQSTGTVKVIKKGMDRLP